MRVIDVSEFQKDIDWSRVRLPAVIRIGIRGSVKSAPEYYGKIRADFYADKNLAGVKKYGVPFSVYFFPTSITDEEAVEEAAWILKKIKGLTISMPVWLDSESVDRGSGRADNLTREKRTHLLRVITDHLEAAGAPCGIYASTSWLENRLDMSKFPVTVRNNTWVAQNPRLTYTGAACMWQYGKTEIPGVPGQCDINETLTQFDMTVKEEPVAYYRSVYVNKAASFVGTTEGTAKFREIINTYNNYTSSHSGPWRKYTVKTTDEWCATFVSSIAIMCGYQSIIPIECGCPQMIEQAKQKGIWKESDSYKPGPGDIILYDWQDSGAGDNTGVPDHIGIVEKATTTLITVIEGNFNEAVRRRAINVNGKYIRGFITPRYTAAAPVEDKTVDLTIKLPEIHPGDKGEAVRLWQFLIGANITGIYDASCENTTRAWQKANGKKVDGWVGKGCWTKALKKKGWM